MLKKISNNRSQETKNGFFVIKPAIINVAVPLFCPCCKSKMKNAQDAYTFRKYQACFDCTTIYAEPNSKKWLEGWRPDLLEIT